MEDEDQKRAKYITLFLIAVLAVFLGVFLFKSFSTTPSMTYNDFFVQKTDSGYKTRLYIGDQGPFYVNTIYSPRDLEDIIIDFSIKDIIKGKSTIYMAIDPYDTNLTGKTTQAALELDGVIEPFFRTPVLSAFTKEMKNTTIKSCPEQNKSEAVFLLELGEESKVLKKDNCIILRGKTQDDLLMEADAVIFQLLGVKK